MADEKIAIVTGGNRGMGFETCRQLGRLGFKVILCCRDPQAGELAAAKLRDEGLSVEAFRLDLTRAEEIAALVMYARRSLRRVDILVNNAGIYLESRRKHRQGSDQRLRCPARGCSRNFGNKSDRSLRSVAGHHCTHARSRSWSGGERDERYGSAMRHGRWCAGFRLAAVGINGMTKIFAEEVRGTNVLVNSVDPGWVRTRSPDATRSIEEGVATTVWLATLPKGGPSGQFFRDKQPLPW